MEPSCAALEYNEFQMMMALVSLLLLQDEWSFAETPKIVANGRRLWVATTGDDSNPGTRDRPFRTITKALAEARPGDTIQVRKGRYTGERAKLNFGRSGTPDAWIVLRSADGPGAAEIDAEKKVLEVFLITDRSYVAIEGLKIHSSQDNVVHIGTNASYVILRDCTISGADGGGDAIKVNGSHHIYIENNDCSDAADELIDFMAVMHSVSRGNFMHHPRKGSTATFAKGGSRYILFERNVVLGVRGAHAIMLGGDSGKGLFHKDCPDAECEKMIVRNNVIVDCDDSAIEARGCRDGWVLHNTIVACATTFACFVVRPGRTNDGGESPSKNIRFIGNLVWNNGDLDRPYLIAPRCGEGFESRHNLWYNGRSGVPRKGEYDVSKELQADPRLISTDLAVSSWKDARRFALQPNSPAVNHGLPHPMLREDFVGKTRDQAPDIGAFER